jgi:hypothetical protein
LLDVASWTGNRAGTSDQDFLSASPISETTGDDIPSLDV